MPIGKKQARLMLAQLKEIRRDATMESASFGCPGENISTSGSFAGEEDGIEYPTEYIKRKTELYRQSWIIGPLDSVIEELEQAAK